MSSHQNVVTATIVLAGNVDADLVREDPWSVVRAAVLAEEKIGDNGLDVTFVSTQLGLSREARALGADLPALGVNADVSTDDLLSRHEISLCALSPCLHDGEVVAQIKVRSGDTLWIGVTDYGDSSEIQLLGRGDSDQNWPEEGPRLSAADLCVTEEAYVEDIAERLLQRIWDLGFASRNAGLAAVNAELGVDS